jgi:hypothetical protein
MLENVKHENDVEAPAFEAHREVAPVEVFDDDVLADSLGRACCHGVDLHPPHAAPHLPEHARDRPVGKAEIEDATVGGHPSNRQDVSVVDVPEVEVSRVARLPGAHHRRRST